MLSNWKYPHIFFIINKEYPTVFLKFSTLFNKKHCIFFSQVFQVINKKYLTFLKCLSHYLIKSNPIFFIANNKYPTIFLQVFHIL
jgi:hypothetical protein